MTYSIIKKVAIIGGGPSGLALVKTLNAENFDFDIDLYESRNKLGGIWNYLTTKGKYNTDDELIKDKEYNHSPMYRKLETNILYKSMEYANFHFPEDSQDFPFRTDVLEYLNGYSKTIGDCNIFLNRRVFSIEKNEHDGIWTVSSFDVETGENKTISYDAVIIANGHFEVPRFPEVKGLDSWRKSYRESITHAKFYDTPERYKDKTLLVVGGVASGSDIAIQSSSTAKKVYVSCDEATVLSNVVNPFIELIPRVDEYDVTDKSITLGGRKITGIDEIIFCTGYLYDVPFLKVDICKKRYISDLYRQIFYIKDPTLSFVGLGKDVNPFPFAEAQSSCIARFYSGRLKLPPFDEMYSHFQQEFKEKSIAIHGLKFPKEADYINGLFQWLEDENVIKEGFIFDKYEGERYERKKRVPEVKLKRILAINESILKERSERTAQAQH